MVTDLQDIAEKVCHVAKQNGATEAFAYLIETKHIATRFGENHITQNVTNIGLTARISLALGNRTATYRGSLSLTNDFIQNTIQALVSRAKISDEDTEFPGFIDKKQQYTDIIGLNPKRNQVVDPEDVKNIVEAVISEAQRKKETQAVSGTIMFIHESHSFATSHEIAGSYQTSYFKGTISVHAMKNGNEGRSSLRTASRSFKIRPFEEAAFEAAETAALNTKKTKIDVGAYKALLEPMALAELIFLILNAAKAQNIQNYSSFLIGKMNSSVFSDHFTLIHDPLDAKNISARPFDDEGIATRSIPIFNKGILKNVAYDLRSAKKDETNSNGCATSIFGDFTAFFSATRVNEGKDTVEQLLGEIKKGVVIKNLFYNNFVDMTKGTATGLTRDGLFIIKNGEITSAARPMRWTDNLMNIFKDFVPSNVPIQVPMFFHGSCILPAALVNQITFTSHAHTT